MPTTSASTYTPRRSGKRAPPTIPSGMPLSANSSSRGPSTTTCACCGARRSSSGRARPRRRIAPSCTSTISTLWTAAIRIPGAASSGASVSSTAPGRPSAPCSARSATCPPPTRPRSSASRPTSPTSSDCLGWPDLRGAVGAARRPQGNGGETERARPRGHRRGGGREQPVDLLDDEEDGEGHDEEVDDRLDEDAVVDRGHPRRLGGGDGGELLPAERDEEVREVRLAEQEADGGHEHVGDERGDHPAEGRADHHAHSELHHVAPHDELFELFQHGAPLDEFSRLAA